MQMMKFYSFIFWVGKVYSCLCANRLSIINYYSNIGKSKNTRSKNVDFYFLSDEIYHGLVYEAGVASALEFSDQVFVINSFSKYFGMTGWRAGWLIVPETYVQATEKLAQNIFISTSSHSQYAALAAFDKETLQVLEARRKDFKLKRDFLYNALLQMGFNIPVKPVGAFYIYADCSQFTNDSGQFAKNLLEQEGLAITPGKDFGENNSGKYCRFSYTASLKNIEKAMIRLQRFIGN